MINLKYLINFLNYEKTKSPKYYSRISNQILVSIERNLLELREKLLNEYENDSASQINRKIIWYQFNRKANVYKKRIEDILGENRESLNNGKKLKEIIDFILSNSNSKSKDL